MKTLNQSRKKSMNSPSFFPQSKKDWKLFFKKSIVIIFLISLALHLLLLIAFGGKIIFKSMRAAAPFTSQNPVSDLPAEVAPPPTEESIPEETVAQPMMPESEPEAAESAAPLEMMTVPGGASWAPALPRDVKASPTGVMGGTGAGTGTGTGTGKGSGGGRAGVKLFGVVVEAKKLGLIVDISGSMQPYIPDVVEEIFKNFPDADVVCVNGCGIGDWEEISKKWTEENQKEQKAAKDLGKRFIGPKSMPKPELVPFNSAKASDCPPIRGTMSYGGFRKDYPEIYDKMAKRSNTWMVTSFSDAKGAGLAFEQLIRRKVGAIYWLADFGDEIGGKTSEEVIKDLLENKTEVFLDSTRGIGKADDFKTKVNAQIVPSHYKK